MTDNLSSPLSPDEEINRLREERDQADAEVARWIESHDELGLKLEAAEAEVQRLTRINGGLVEALTRATESLANGACWLTGTAPNDTGARVLRIAAHDARAALAQAEAPAHE